MLGQNGLKARFWLVGAEDRGGEFKLYSLENEAGFFRPTVCRSRPSVSDCMHICMYVREEFHFGANYPWRRRLVCNDCRRSLGPYVRLALPLLSASLVPYLYFMFPISIALNDSRGFSWSCMIVTQYVLYVVFRLT